MRHHPPIQKSIASSCSRLAIAALFLLFSSVVSNSLAQVPPPILQPPIVIPPSLPPPIVVPPSGPSPITESGLNTQVSEAIGNQFNITGGTRPNDGANLFHSFGEFSVPLNNIANFQNDSSLPTANILSRVTGNEVSDIRGTIRTQGFGDANLYLMNPNGVVFGPNASLDLNGSFHVSTADSIQLGAGSGAVLFSTTTAPNMLTSAPPSAFGFSGSNPLASISVSGTSLSVQPGKVISIIGGDPDGLPQGNQLTDENPGVLISNRSTLSAPGGQINLVSVAGPGTVSTTGPDFTSAVSVTDGIALGTIDITNGSNVDVTGNGGGTIAIRGGRLTLNNRARITAKTRGAGQAGAITVTAPTVDITSGGQISTSSEGTGAAGTILVTATDGTVNLSGNDRQTRNGTNAETAFVSGLFANTEGQGAGGNITIQTQDLNLTEGAVIEVNTSGRGSGDAGTVTINTTSSVSVSGSAQAILSGQTKTIPSTISSNVSEALDQNGNVSGIGLLGSGGSITIEAQNVMINDGSQVTATSSGKDDNLAVGPANGSLPSAGIVDITVFDTLTISDSIVTSTNTLIPSQISVSASGPAKVGDIRVDAGSIKVLKGGLITAETESLARINDPGTISVIARNTIEVSGFEAAPNISVPRLSSIQARTSGVNDAGNITLQAKNLNVTDGGQVVSSSLVSAKNPNLPPGAGGDITVITETISVEGRASARANADRSAINSVTRTAATAGNISISTNDLRVGNGGLILTDTDSSGLGGNVTVTATGTLTVTGVNTEIADRGLESRISSGTRGSGDAGNLSISAKSINVTDGGTIRAGTSEEGKGGALRIEANETLIISNAIDFGDQKFSSNISSNTTGSGSAGGIDVIATNVELTGGGSIATNTIGRGSGNAGNITINATGNVVLKGTSDVVISGFTERIRSAISSNVSETFEGSFGEGLLGSGGTININAQNVTLNDGAQIIASSSGRDVNPAAGPGNGSLPSAGTVDITVVDTLTVSDSIVTPRNTLIPSQISVSASGPAKVGDIRVDAGSIKVLKGGLITAETESLARINDPGTISVIARNTIEVSGFEAAPNISVPRLSSIQARTSGVNDAGNITLQAKNLNVTDGGQIASSSLVSGRDPSSLPGAGGDITVFAETISVAGRASAREFADRSAINSVTRTAAMAGNISIMTSNLAVADGGLIITNTESSGLGGNLSIAAADTLTVTGVNTEIAGRGLESRISSGANAIGDAGTLSLRANNITVTDGGTIKASSSGEGDGGIINLIADNNISVQGSPMIFEGPTPSSIASSSTGAGNSGTVTITAGDILVQNGAKVSTSASGNGKAGDINLGNAQEIQLDGGIIETTAARDAGGNIKLTASDLILIKESQINTSVQGDASNQGGNINIDPEFIVMINSQLEAKAAEGAGGNMDIVANVIFTDFRSSFDATGGDPSQNGTINIQAPIQNLSQAIAPLPEAIVEVAALYNAQCAGQKNGQFSSFTEQGLDRIPYEPGELLPTPFFIPDVSSDQSKKQNTLSSPMVQRLQLPGFDATTSAISTWNIFHTGCRA